MSTCLIFRYAPSYRMPIYELLEKELDVSFIFPRESSINLKKGDYSKLQNCTFCGKEKRIFKKLYYFSNIDKKELFGNNNLIFAGDVRDLTSWYILLKCRFIKKTINTTLWTHGYYGKENLFEKLIKRIYYSLPNHVLLYGQYAKDLMSINKIAPQTKLKVIYNSLDYASQLKLRQKLHPSDFYICHFNNTNKNIVFVGRLTKVKRLDMLLDVIYLLNTKSISINVTFIGDGEAKNELLSKTKILNIEKQVFFFGETYDEVTLSTLIYNADLCVSPGNIGLTAIHSLSFGTPVITHDTLKLQGPEFEAIEEGKTGLFFKFNDVDSLASKIKEWFEYDYDRESIRENCYKMIDEKYNPYNQLKVIQSILQ